MPVLHDQFWKDEGFRWFHWPMFLVTGAISLMIAVAFLAITLWLLIGFKLWLIWEYIL